MPDQSTRADSLRLYLTGAAADGGDQSDPAASLGNFRSNAAETHFTYTQSNPISNVVIEFISGAHAEGNGTLIAVGDDSLAWTAPGGVQGAAVTIADGETKLLESFAAPGKYLVVSRISADPLSGVATVSLSIIYNNATGFDNVSAAEASAGDVTYRALMIRNNSEIEVNNLIVSLVSIGTSRISAAAHLPASGAGSIDLSAGDYSDWPDSGFCRIEDVAGELREIVYYASRTDAALTVPTAGRGLLGTAEQLGDSSDLLHAVPGSRFAVEPPAADSAISSIGDESVQPLDLIWSTAITKAAGLEIGTLAPGAAYGIWIERVVVANSTSEGTVIRSFRWNFDAT